MILRWLLLFAVLAVAPAAAQVNTPATSPRPLLPVASPVVQTENVRAELISEVATVKPGEPFWVGLHQKIRPKWHTYWRNPGDSGMPTTLAWTLPLGAGASEIVWPLPERFRLGPIINYGYHNDVLLPVQITPPATLQPGETFTFAADATWLVCEDVCIPEEGRVTLTLPVASAVQPGEPATRQRFEAARRAVPIASPWEAHYVARDAKRLTLTVRAAGLKRDTIADAYFYPLPMSPVEHTADQAFAISASALTLELARSAAAPNLPQELSGVLVIREKTGAGEVTQAFELTAALDGSGATAASRVPLPGAGSATFATAGEEIGFWQALIFALIGGLILNLMPCVFPVLSMKALALAQHARAERWPQRAHGLAYTAGVLASFAAIGALIAGLRAGGESLGWGFQFQSPLFTLLIAWLFFVIGLNLSGIFEIGGRIAGVGAGLAARAGYSGSFFTGVLAAVVATPCTAPFMAAAVGFALAQPATTSIAVLLAMGLGLALPFLLLSFSPALLRILPRPGTWMVRFRQVLAFPMYASAAWLVWVLAQQAGSDGVLYGLCGMVLLGFAFWLWQALREAGSAGWRVVAAGAIAASLAGAIALAVSVGSAAPSYATSAASAPSPDANWERFSRARLAELRAEGKPVFVNFTAAWCITCLANERVALSTDAVRRAFADRGIVYLKGDWTNRDPEITATLKEFGRAGVPLYLWYAGPADRPPMVLPQILTEAEILAQIGR